MNATQQQTLVIINPHEVAVYLDKFQAERDKVFFEELRKLLFSSDPLESYPELMSTGQCSKVTGFAAFAKKAHSMGLERAPGTDKWSKEDIRRVFFSGKNKKK